MNVDEVPETELMGEIFKQQLTDEQWMLVADMVARQARFHLSDAEREAASEFIDLVQQFCEE